MLTFIEFSTTTIAGILGVAGNVISDLKLPIVLLLGFFIGFFVIDLVIGFVRGKKGGFETQEEAERYEEPGYYQEDDDDDDE